MHSKRSSSSRPTILVVEDDALSRRVLCGILEARAFRVLAAADVAQAREMAAAEAGVIRFVVSDIGLPDGDGWSLMRELVRTHSLKGIAVSAYGARADHERSRAAGFLCHLVKPLRVAELENALAEAGITAAPCDGGSNTP